MSQYPEIGATARFAKTVTETDVTLFAGMLKVVGALFTSATDRP